MKIAIIAGDGIGKDVTAEAIKVLTSVGDVFGRIHFQAKRIAPDRQAFFDAVCGNTDVIKFQQPE